MPVIDAEKRRVWLALRMQGLGASDIPVLYGLSKWKSPYALWLEKTRMTEPMPEDAMSGPAEWGLRLESAIATKFAEETRRLVPEPDDQYQILTHPDHPFLQATIDRDQVLVVGAQRPDFDVAGDVGILELKTAVFHKAEEWEDGEPPLAYQVQLQAQLLVTGRSFGSLAVLVGGHWQFLWCDLPANPSFQQNIVQQAAAFWARVQQGEAPPVDASDATKDAIKRAFPDVVSGELIALPPEAVAWDDARTTAIDAGKQWEAHRQAAENQLRAAIGPNAGGVLPDGTTYNLKLQKKKQYVVAASEARVLRRKGA